jgi:(S)-2-hydroxyglutarate dehydrogenase
MKVDCAIIGGGIVGLSVGMALLKRQPGVKLLVLEKENALAAHQTGRNSGVIHAGIYYKPGSLKARFARDGNRSMVAFCQDHGIAHEVCGKVIVATEEKELPVLDSLYRRGLENGLNVVQVDREQVKEIEPHVRCLRGLQVPSTGIVSYRMVCEKFAELIREKGGVVRTEAQVFGIREHSGRHLLEIPNDEIEAKFLVNCGGLHSDRVARKAGLDVAARIVPFRGEYYELVPGKRHLVSALIYPVPDPAFPFLGVHFTRMIDGSVHAGPNAVLAFRREGYRKSDFSFGDLYETLTYRGFWNVARRHYKEGLKEIWRSLNKRAFVKSLQRLIPEVAETDLVAAPSGVRAQALLPDGNLVDDFLIERGTNSIHICNAPSPAATASLEIGKFVANEIPELRSAARESVPGLEPFFDGGQTER